MWTGQRKALGILDGSEVESVSSSFWGLFSQSTLELGLLPGRVDLAQASPLN